MCRVLWAAPILPRVSMAIKPMWLALVLIRRFTSFIAASAATCGVPLRLIISHVVFAMTNRMATSPIPVAEHAPASLSA